MTEHRSGCLVCGKDLVYEGTARPLRCVYCNREFRSNVACEEGHYVCDGCHSAPANQVIRQFCIESDSRDPVRMAITLMRHPSVRMHGPEHHFLVPAVLVSAYYNLIGKGEEKAERIAEAEARSAHVLGGFCGTHGSCGAAIGAGLFVSIVTDTTPLSRETWRLSNLVTSRALAIIAEHGGPRCCKRTSLLAILEAARFAEEHLGVRFEAAAEPVCEFSPMNKECIGKGCPFHKVRSDAEK